VLHGGDPDLGRDVAIKVLRDDLRDSPDMVRRFVEEAQIGCQLQHPGIVPICELGAFADRRPFFSMKLVKGHTLAALLGARKDLPGDLPRFLNIVESVAQAVIHRDLGRKQGRGQLITVPVPVSVAGGNRERLRCRSSQASSTGRKGLPAEYAKKDRLTCNKIRYMHGLPTAERCGRLERRVRSK
jgi:hypothetical protein